MSEFSGNALVERAELIQTREDFTVFVSLLLRNQQEHPEEWENNTIELFLQGLGGFVGSIKGYYSNIGSDVDTERPGWRVLADALLAARVYE